jgi:hypothetical protein
VSQPKSGCLPPGKIFIVIKKKFIAPRRKIIFLAAAVAILAARPGFAGEPYLASVGPPPLRFEVVATDNALFLSKLELPKPKPVPQPAIAPPPFSEASKHTEIAGGPGMNVPSAAGNGLPVPAVPAITAATPPNAASDLLNITPQMINDYFRPSQIQGPPSSTMPFQPGQPIFVPAELGFVPPTPPVIGNSQAIYQSK